MFTLVSEDVCLLQIHPITKYSFSVYILTASVPPIPPQEFVVLTEHTERERECLSASHTKCNTTLMNASRHDFSYHFVLAKLYRRRSVCVCRSSDLVTLRAHFNKPERKLNSIRSMLSMDMPRVWKLFLCGSLSHPYGSSVLTRYCAFMLNTE